MSLHNPGGPSRDALGSPPFAPVFLLGSPLGLRCRRCHSRQPLRAETLKGKEETWGGKGGGGGMGDNVARVFICLQRAAGPAKDDA